MHRLRSEYKQLSIHNRPNFASYSVVVMSLTEVEALGRMVCGSILGYFSWDV